jgi:uncharacterized membrane protein YraQ (UPF0718 family)
VSLLNFDDFIKMIWGSLSIIEKGMIIFTVIIYGLFAVYNPSTRMKTTIGLENAAKSLVRISLLLLSGVFLGSLIGAILPRNTIAKFLGGESGFVGILFGTLFGAVIPSGPYVLFPIVGGLYSAGASIPPLIAMIMAWQTIAIPRIPTDLAFLSAVEGQKLVWLRLIIGIPLPLIAGILAGYITSYLLKL